MKELQMQYKYKYTDDQLKEIVARSSSMSQVLRELGVKPGGGNHTSMKSRLRRANISYTHFTGRSWTKGKSLPQRQRPLEDYLSNRVSIGSHELKKKLLFNKLLESRCLNCSLTHWLGEPIPLELHHKDKNHFNNNLENLCILCPNCHALIPRIIKEKIKQEEKIIKSLHPRINEAS